MYRNLNFKKNLKLCSSINSSYPKRNGSTKPRIVQSNMPKVTIPNQSVEEYMFERFEKWPTKIALQCSETGRSYTFGEVHRKSQSLANFLHKLKNLKQGDTVAISLPNVPEYPIIFLGAILAGLKVTTVNSAYTAGEIAAQLDNSDTKLVFTLNGPWYTATNQAVKSLANKNIPMVVINHEQSQSTPVGSIKFDEIVNGDYDTKLRSPSKADDVIALPYSSGTTGLPKGVELTTRNIVANLAQISTEPISYIFEPEDVVPAILPMFHIYGLAVLMLNVLSYGCKLVTMPKFLPELYYKLLDEHKPTLSFLVPPLILLLINSDKITAEHLERMKAVCSGAAPLGAADVIRLKKKATNHELKVIQGYGLTETIIMSTQTDHLPNGMTLGGSGLLLPETECKIVSVEDNTTVLGPNQPGELFIRGPQVMKGYHKNPKATEAVIDSEGWFSSGDIGYYDEDDHFFITDRLKELIKVNAFQVAPAELEELLRSHPDINDAAVIGVPHPTTGEVPKAFIVPKKGKAVEPSKIQEFVAANAAKHKQLNGGVIIIDSIPKSLSGKILRRELRKM